MNELKIKAEKYIYENANSLQKACMDYIADKGNKKKIIQELSTYQNADGGWVNGLEVEYPGSASSPFTTAAALGYIAKFDLKDTSLYHNTLAYLKDTQHQNGMWDDTDKILAFPHPPYMGPGIYPDYKTGMILKWLLRLNTIDKAMINGARDYMIQAFDEISSKTDFWSAVAYSGAFSMLPHVKEYSKIMEWSMKILMPNESQFGWQQVMGMIEDDTPIPEQAYDMAIKLINENQEEDGGWPHQFGTYNRVWSAIYILRFLKNKKLIY
ncbi:prenyltransferase/squalene oxidase repeat-containing protein [Vallitalea guaymasensis]|uniref:Squalene cyclase C-terminal domain-containing protein n=1 Tax=Vallitalea guaymasensis TaxID=1185412 RepID=A0A8J8MDF8_9FIRM|nr:hypothetical protein [Vallitalea guaymasensis]QUH30635.1 hypothetical protein HYG85_17625 [Vallitalea guaymasensis]